MKSKQEKLANLFVQDVPKFGWSRDTLLQCAKKQRISTSVLAKLFPSFEYDVLKFIIAQNNNKVEKNYNSFNEIEWQEMTSFASDTFVEESDELKEKSAGAGLTDND